MRLPGVAACAVHALSPPSESNVLFASLSDETGTVRRLGAPQGQEGWEVQAVQVFFVTRDQPLTICQRL